MNDNDEVTKLRIVFPLHYYYYYFLILNRYCSVSIKVIYICAINLYHTINIELIKDRRAKLVEPAVCYCCPL